MSRIIAIDYEKCVGCRTCEMVCSLSHDKEVDPFHSRIKVVRWENSIHAIPLNCRQCENAPCMDICSTGAISREPEINCTKIDYDKCIGCRSCVYVCHFGVMAFHSENKRVFKCDLCDGEPVCVKFCAYGALTYVESDEANKDKLIEFAESVLKTTLR